MAFLPQSHILSPRVIFNAPAPYRIFVVLLSSTIYSISYIRIILAKNNGKNNDLLLGGGVGVLRLNFGKRIKFENVPHLLLFRKRKI